MHPRRAVNRVGLAMTLSPLVHVGLGAALLAMPAIPRESPSANRLASSGRGLMQLSFEPPLPVVPPPEPVRPKPVPPPPAETPPPPPAPEEEPPDIVLGIESSSQKSPNWIGFDDPTKHEARKSLTEQAALSPDTPAPVAPPPTVPAVAAPTAVVAPSPTPVPPPAPVSEPASPPPAPPKAVPPPPTDQPATGEQDNTATPAPPRPEPEGPNPDVPRGPEPGPGTGDTAKSEARPDPREKPAEGVETDKSPATDKPDKPQPETADRPDPRDPAILPNPESSSNATPPAAVPPNLAVQPGPSPAAAPVPPTPMPGVPGQKSPKESDATSLSEPLEVRPGRPAAAQGLEITTRRPVFTTVTQLTTFPQNPVLKITFNRFGRVANHEWVQKSGYENVDSPVLNAVYGWTAKGKALNDLPRNKPDAGVTITVRIILR